MANGVFRQGLQRERRQKERRALQIEFDLQLLPEAELLQLQIRLRMLQLCRERDRLALRERIHVVPQVAGESVDRRFRLRVIFAQVADGAQRIEHKVRLDLAEHNVHAQPGVFGFLLRVALSLVALDVKEHKHSGGRCAENDHKQTEKEHLEQHGEQRKEDIDGKGGALLVGKAVSPADQHKQIHQHDEDRRRQQRRVVRSAVIEACRVEVIDRRGKLRIDQQRHIDRPKHRSDAEHRAVKPVGFAALLQQEAHQKKREDGGESRFKEQRYFLEAGVVPRTVRSG